MTDSTRDALTAENDNLRAKLQRVEVVADRLENFAIADRARYLAAKDPVTAAAYKHRSHGYGDAAEAIRAALGDITDTPRSDS